MIPPIRKLLSWLFRSFADTTSCSLGIEETSSVYDIDGASSTTPDGNITILRELYIEFYRNVPEQRESVLSFLLNECFSLCGTISMATASLKQIISYQHTIQSEPVETEGGKNPKLGKSPLSELGHSVRGLWFYPKSGLLCNRVNLKQ